MENNNEIKIDVLLSNKTYKKKISSSSKADFESGYKMAIIAKVEELAKQKSDVELYKLDEIMKRQARVDYTWVCGFEGAVTKEQAMSEAVLQSIEKYDFKLSDVYIFEMPKGIKLTGQRKSTHTFYGFIENSILNHIVEQSVRESKLYALVKTAFNKECERMKAAGLLG